MMPYLHTFLREISKWFEVVIFTASEDQRVDAIQSFAEVSNELGKPISDIKVEVKKVKKFWLAEDYHQDFARNNRLKYDFYRYSCGRDKRLDQLWGKRARTGEKWTSASKEI